MTAKDIYHRLTNIGIIDITYDGLEQDLIKNCIKLQGYTLLITGGNENDRNTYLRDLLDTQDYDVYDQTLNGISAAGINAGELDLLIKNKQKEPFSIIEALNLDYLNKSYLEAHINKIFKYDTWGAKKNFILVYTKCENFKSFSNKYAEYVKDFNYPYPLLDFIERTQYADIHTYDSILERNGFDTIVTHILVKLK